MYSCYDQPSSKSFTVDQWINKNDKCPQESSSKPTEQEVLQDHRDPTPESEVLKKHAEISINQIVDVNEASVKIDKSEESVAANDLAVKNQNEMPIIFKCRPMVELIARASESNPEADSDSADSSVLSDSLPNDHFVGNSEGKGRMIHYFNCFIGPILDFQINCTVLHDLRKYQH